MQSFQNLCNATFFPAFRQTVGMVCDLRGKRQNLVIGIGPGEERTGRGGQGKKGVGDFHYCFLNPKPLLLTYTHEFAYNI